MVTAAMGGWLQPVVTATYWVDPGERGTPYDMVIKFTGRRAGTAGKPSPADRFGRSAGGAVFIGAMAAYTLARQGLLTLRAEPRRWALGLPVTLAVAATALFTGILIAALR